MKKTNIKVGDVFHRLTVVELIPDAKNPKARCRCECGNIVTPQRGSLRNGRAKSCGCHRREMLLKASASHGMSETPEYKAYQAAKLRCQNPNVKEHENYGGRGIKFLYRSFEEFIADIGPRPEGAWLDRENNEGHYQPGNCRWVTPSLNQSNKRVSKRWSILGVEYVSSVEAAKALGIKACQVHRRCNGYWRRGKWNPPLIGWTCRLFYDVEALQ